jgi:Protein of unknown function (DUF4236)
MGWRFRKSFKVLPGVRLNVSTRGVSTSIGGAPFTVNIGPRGVHSTVSIPGTGLSLRGRIGSPTSRSNLPASVAGSDAQFVPPSPAPIQPDLREEIRSAGTDVLTSLGLAEFRNLLRQADAECTELTNEIATATPRAAAARGRQRRWERGFLFKRLRKAKFGVICEEAETSEAKLGELQQQLELARLATEITVESEIADPYSRLCDAFAAMTQSQRIWDTMTRKATDRVAERTAATEAITREPVVFRRGQSDVLKCEWAVPCLENRSGGDMYLYPAFVLYRVTRETFAVIDIHDVTIEYAPCRFIEREAILGDSPIVGQTWLKVNKNGTPDRRFKDNVQIPIVQYGTLKLRSGTGLHEEYLVSNASSCEAFTKAWNAFKKSFAPSMASQIEG